MAGASFHLKKFDAAIASNNDTTKTVMERVAAESSLCKAAKQSIPVEYSSYVLDIIRAEVSSCLGQSESWTMRTETEGSGLTVEILYSPTEGDKPVSIVRLELCADTVLCERLLRELLHIALDIQVRSRLAQVMKGEKPTLFQFSVGVQQVADAPPMDPMEMGELK